MKPETQSTAYKVFVDTDVIIDFLIDRQPHARPATMLFHLADTRQLTLCTSSLCLCNVHYIVRKIMGDQQARIVIDDLMELIEVMSVSKSDIQSAVISDFSDFEDAVQHSVATSDHDIKSIITRNTRDYSRSRLVVFEPEVFIQVFKNQA